MVKFKLPSFYQSPMTQVVLVGITCFATVGMFVAVSNLGAGGTQDVVLYDVSQGVLYGTFALAGLISGAVNNLLGPRLTLFIGSLGYALYVGSLWCFQTQGTRWFPIFAGAIVGFTAAMLWSAQGSIMMSYPLEKDKGKAFGIFWAIFQFGSFIGSVIALAINLENGSLGAVSNSTYTAFVVIIFIGVASSFLVLPPNRVIRSDGTVVKLETTTKIRDEFSGMVRLLKDWKTIALLPLFFSADYFYAYSGAINAGMFDGPTRTLNATLQSAGAIIGALFIGFFVLDNKWFARRTRGYLGLALLTTLEIIVWAVTLSWQLTFDRADATAMKEAGKLINYKDSNYKGKGALFFFLYFTDACYQAVLYWIMAALTNEPFVLARFAGVYKALQSAGIAASFGMDATSTPYLNEHLATWCIILISFVPTFFVIRTVKETNYEPEQIITVHPQDVTDTAAEEGRSENSDSGISVEKIITQLEVAQADDW